ncbi:hypothetical protein DCCM_4713 [Desulfocucumis palustris]|uniref:Uncharacterized protein n=1 Tax=Desulfocucumis palustris TaxID=1898651 RepID=A0A2L2XHX4_9FIRM|nr:hypothetical protein DCCM_4713 [Desulfocucumis palustris]
MPVKFHITILISGLSIARAISIKLQEHFRKSFFKRLPANNKPPPEGSLPGGGLVAGYIR